jgi:hypothetical protein
MYLDIYLQFARELSSCIKMDFTPLGAELDFDTDQLCSLFDALSQELSKPFIEKRVETGSNKKDPLGNL